MNPSDPGVTWRCEHCGSDNPAAATACSACAAPHIADADDSERSTLSGDGPNRADLQTVGEAHVLQAVERSAGTVRLDGPIAPDDAKDEPPASTVPLPANTGPKTTVLQGVTDEVLPQESEAPAPSFEVRRSTIASRDVPTIAMSAVGRRRTHRSRRAVPLIALAAFATAALAAAAAYESSRRPPSIDAADEEASVVDARVVSLPAVDATLGLTDDNKEVVLTLCHRLSDHPSSECRRSYLTGLGEYPHRVVSFPAMQADAFEVSNAGYERCVAAGACPPRDFEGCSFYSPARGRELREPVPGSMQADNLPAVCVTFDEAAAHCAWRQMRLPSADEWERIARSGDDRLQPWGEFVLPGLMNWGERILKDFPIPGRVDGEELTARIDEYAGGATDEGVRNMLGNAAEWVLPGERDDEGSAGVRGGSYVANFRAMRITLHDSLRRSERRSTVGFRCVADD